MNKQGKLYFHDAGGKFNSAKHSLLNLIDDSDIFIYSLTEKGNAEPSWLIIKVAAAGDIDYYLNSSADKNNTPAIIMCIWDYSSFSSKSLFREVSDLTYAVAYMNEKKMGVRFYKCEGFRDAQLKASEFFSLNVDPESTEEGTEIYLRDKAFFVEGRKLLPAEWIRKMERLDFYDDGGKFTSVSDTFIDLLENFDICVYSLTAIGHKEPKWLVIKVMKSNCMDLYLNHNVKDIAQRCAVMVKLDYEKLHPNKLLGIVSKLTSIFNYNAGRNIELELYEHRGGGLCKLDSTYFFSMDVDPESQESGAEIYLRDKEFFVEGRID